MVDKALYAAILGVTQPWSVEKVALRLADGEVHVWVALPAPAPLHDHRERVWRHLDTRQYRTLVHARVPLRAAGQDWLTGTKYDWLRDPARFTLGAWRAFVGFARRTKLKTGRAWALKEMRMTRWDYRYPGAAERHFTSWYQWAIRSRLEPVKRVARMLKRHWPNIRTFFTQRITNAGAESMNSKIQKLKVLARGFRNRERFRNGIYCHLGGLDLYPRPLTPSA